MDENHELEIPGQRNIGEKEDIVSEKPEKSLEVSDTDEEFPRKFTLLFLQY